MIVSTITVIAPTTKVMLHKVRHIRTYVGTGMACDRRAKRRIATRDLVRQTML